MYCALAHFHPETGPQRSNCLDFGLELWCCGREPPCPVGATWPFWLWYLVAWTIAACVAASARRRYTCRRHSSTGLRRRILSAAGKICRSKQSQGLPGSFGCRWTWWISNCLSDPLPWNLFQLLPVAADRSYEDSPVQHAAPKRVHPHVPDFSVTSCKNSSNFGTNLWRRWAATNAKVQVPRLRRARRSKMSETPRKHDLSKCLPACNVNVTNIHEMLGMWNLRLRVYD